MADIDSDITCASNINYVEQIEMNHSVGADLSKDFRLSDLEIKTTPIEVFIKPDTIKAPDDLFADIFDETTVESKSKLVEPIPSVSTAIQTISHDDEKKTKEVNPSTSKEYLKTVKDPIVIDTLKRNENKAKLNDILQELVKDLNNVMENGVSNILNDIVNDDDSKPSTSKSIPNIKCIASELSRPSEVKDVKINDLIVQKEKQDESIEAESNVTIELNEQETNKIEEKNQINSTQLTSQKSTIILPVQSINAANLTNILENLDKDLSSVKETTTSLLENTKLPVTKPSHNHPDPNEIIEILDDNDVLIKTPSKPKKQSQISDYLSSDSKIKKTTPSPSQNAEIDLNTPKIASPFFRKKTSSSKKSAESNHATADLNQPSTSKKLAAKKNLFNNDVTTMVQKAVEMVNECKTTDELTAMASTVRQEKQDLEFERNKQDRGAVSVTDRMSQECRELLKLFGIPYIIAPMEAEAQCAFLDAIDLTDGTITDDSDIWLFGGQTVYKNFFNQQKLVLEYRVDAIDRLFKVNREKMIQLAMLVGSDYTQGEDYR